MKAISSTLRTIFVAGLGGLVVFAGIAYFGLSQKVVYVREDPVSVKTSAAIVEREDKTLFNAQQIYEKYSAGVVHVRATVTSSFNDYFGLPIPKNQVSSGSGFIISNDGYIITNAHVVSGANEIEIQLSDDAIIPAELVGIDQSSDMAVIKVDLGKHNFTVLTLGNSKNIDVGQSVFAIGNPLGLDRSMSRGIISALNREIEAPNGFPIRDVIQTDAAINRGNSGGPLISSNGKVIGVTAQIATEGAGNIGIAFAIPSSIVKKIFREIKETGKASHPWMGIVGDTLTPEMAKELKLKTDKGVLVVAVMSPSPAQKAGLKGADKVWRFQERTYEVGGDIITKVGNSAVTSMEDLMYKINKLSVGDSVDFTIIRNDKEIKTKMKLTERPIDLDSPR